MKSASSIRMRIIYAVLQVVLIWSWMTIAARADDWPMLRHDAQNTGYTNDAVKPPLHLVWRTKMGETDNLLASGGGVCVQRSAEYEDFDLRSFTIIGASTGKTVWQTKNAEAVYMKGDLLVLLRPDPKLTKSNVRMNSIQCWNWKSRKLIWTHDLPVSITTPGGAIEQDGILYCSFNGRIPDPQFKSGWSLTSPGIVAISMRDGSLVSQNLHIDVAGGVTYGSPAIDGKSIFVTVSAWGVTADVLMLNVGTLSLERRLVNAGTTTPIITGDHVIAQSWSIYVGCTDKTSGKLAWSSRTGAIAGHCLIPRRNGVKLVIEPVALPKQIAAYDIDTGKVVWRYPILASSYAVGSGRYLFFGGGHEHLPSLKTPVGGFYCFDANTGKQIWKYERPNLRVQSVIVSDGSLFGIGSDGYLYKFAGKK